MEKNPSVAMDEVKMAILDELELSMGEISYDRLTGSVTNWPSSPSLVQINKALAELEHDGKITRARVTVVRKLSVK